MLDTRFRNVEATTENTRIETQRLAARMTLVEGDIRELKDQDTAIVRQQSEGDLEQAAALGGAITHVARLESAVQAQGETLAGLVASQGQQTATLANLNTLITFVTGAVTKNVLWVKIGLAAGASLGATIAAVYMALAGQ